MRSANSSGSTSSSPRALRISLYAARRKYAFDTPGISTGYWNARKMPACARSSGCHLEQILAVVRHRAAGDLVRRIARQHLRERALARAVRAHDRVDFAGVHGEVDALEDRLIADAGFEVFNDEQ